MLNISGKKFCLQWVPVCFLTLLDRHLGGDTGASIPDTSYKYTLVYAGWFCIVTLPSNLPSSGSNCWVIFFLRHQPVTWWLSASFPLETMHCREGTFSNHSEEILNQPSASVLWVLGHRGSQRWGKTMGLTLKLNQAAWS